ncbi:MAG: NADH:ubiquinone reductase (Na(+)-transporting) subunit F [Alphaproteobacteria bacterium]|nr:NADH:ubiquinone reductase (Na(+)-transporting) subunit F [Alphaproteobacteria bacterium]
MTEILLGSAVFTGLIMLLALVVLGARTVLMPRGLARITVNGERVLDAALGEKLLHALEHGGVHLPTSCGGAGTCGLCRVNVTDSGKALPVERATLGEADVATGARLACQMVVRDDLAVSVSPELLAAESWLCTVRRTRTVAPLIKEIELALPEGKAQSFRAGSYVQVTAPAFTLPFSEIAVDQAHEDAWTHLGLRKLTARSDSPVTRAYSLANHPGETDALLLNIRLALPPGGMPDVPPGVVSSWLFGLGAGNTVSASGPFGNFFVMETDREMVLIGGGVGMAPLRSHVFDQLEYRVTTRAISFWYGARGLIDLYYADDMERLAREHDNFSWHVALSDPEPGDAWNGETGFIHDVVYRNHLQAHPDPAACEYYLCGPPLMIEAVQAMLDRLGVPRENILYDDFGG